MYDAFFGEAAPTDDGRDGTQDGWLAGEARWTMSLPLALTAVVSLVLGLAPNLLVGFYQLAWTAAISVAGASELGAIP